MGAALFFAHFPVNAKVILRYLTQDVRRARLRAKKPHHQWEWNI